MKVIHGSRPFAALEYFLVQEIKNNFGTWYNFFGWLQKKVQVFGGNLIGWSYLALFYLLWPSKFVSKKKGQNRAKFRFCWE